MSQAIRLGLTALVGLASVGCEQGADCTFRNAAASPDGMTRVAMIVATDVPRDDAEVDGMSRGLAALGFPDENVCVLKGKRATLAASEQALQALTAVSGKVVRFFYFTGYGSEARDVEVDEPDERDETLVFTDADGKGAGELRDDELAQWLGRLAKGAESSLAVVNGDFRALGVDGASTERYRKGDVRRTVGREGMGPPDRAALLLAPSPAGHARIARGTGGSAAAFAAHVARAMETANGRTLTGWTRRLGVELRQLGIDAEVSGEGHALMSASSSSGSGTAGSTADLSVSLREEGKAGGVARATRDAVTAALRELAPGVAIRAADADFEVSQSGDGAFVLRGPDHRVRNRVVGVPALKTTLAGHAAQWRLLGLQGNGGAELRDFDTVQLSLRPAVSQPRCADGLWDQAAAGGVQRIPLCHQWYVEAKAAEGTPPLHVVVLGLSSDGTSYALAPNDGAQLAGVHRFDDQTLVAGPPVDVFEQILAIASPQPLDAKRILTEGEAALAGATYTVSALTYQVVANDAFLRADEVTGREYTVHNFDIRPYLPDDQGTALARFLLKADALAKASAADGYSYKQHDWKKPTDAENLALGIDCSRSIWFAFTRSGLRYNRRDEYLATVGMLPSSTAMADQFDACSIDGDYRLGDVLVYRSDERGDGHVVVVIDPAKRIAWGSHGWDGTPRDEPALKADTGVEYQKIKVKTDWMKWDRSDMQLKACWRYREFAREQATGRGAAGTAILNERCGC